MATSSRTRRRLTPPLILTLLRFALAPLFALAPNDVWRGAVLLAATATEWLDGWLARRTAQTSRLGEWLDPAADRVFVLVALLTFVAIERLSVPNLLLLLVRDFFTALAAGVSMLLRVPVRFKARWSGKIVTTLQLLALIALLVYPAIIGWLAPVVAALGLVAVIDYAVVGWRRLGERKAAERLEA